MVPGVPDEGVVSHVLRSEIALGVVLVRVRTVAHHPVVNVVRVSVAGILRAVATRVVVIRLITAPRTAECLVRELSGVVIRVISGRARYNETLEST